jgi:predicted ATPase
VALLSSQPGNLILCENPEAYLHPKGQRRIGKLIALTAEMGVQIILETHSDHVLNGVRLAAHNKVIKDSKVVRTHYFERVGGDGIKPCKMSSPELTQSGRYNFWPSGFFDEFASALDELLEPPR